MKWTVDITNDPDRDYELCAEFNFGDVVSYVRIGRSDSGEIVLTASGARRSASLGSCWQSLRLR